MRSRTTIEFIGLWEQLNNPDFKWVEFDSFLLKYLKLWLLQDNKICKLFASLVPKIQLFLQEKDLKYYKTKAPKELTLRAFSK